MKKLFIIGLASAAMLAGCSNDETVEMAQRKAIGFSSFVNKSTKATAADDISISNIGSIEVYGWRDDDQIFNAQEVTINATSGEGTYSPIQYWAGGYTYAFEAIAPKNGADGVSFAAAKTGGKISFENNAETDLVYSKASDVTTESPLSASPGKVSFTFGHLLSRVKFTFVNGFPENSVAAISVSDVKITNAAKSGTITPAADNAAWTISPNDVLEVAFANVDATDIAGNAKGETEHMYLIPVESPEYTVTFTATLDLNGAVTPYSHTSTITTSMRKGMSYNFVATLDEKNISDSEVYPIEFKAEIDEWGAFNDTDVEVE